MNNQINPYSEEIIVTTSTNIQEDPFKFPTTQTLEKFDSQRLFVSSNDSWTAHFYHNIGLLSQSSDYFEKLSPEFIELFFTNLQSELREQIYNIRKLEENWDDMGAKPFKEEIFKKVEDIVVNIYFQILANYPQVLTILPQPYILPNSDGTIDITWRNSTIYLVINISLEARIFAAGKSIDDDNISFDTEKDIKKLVGEWLMLVYTNQ